MLVKYTKIAWIPVADVRELCLDVWEPLCDVWEPGLVAPTSSHGI